MSGLRQAWDVLRQGKAGADAVLHVSAVVGRLAIAAVMLMAVIAILLALEPTP